MAKAATKMKTEKKDMNAEVDTNVNTDLPTLTETPKREHQNGFTRPLAGTKTGLIWDIADALSAKFGRPAQRGEVFDAYRKQVPDASDGTMSTQYSRWSGFHGVTNILREQRAAEKAAKDAERDAAKAERAKKAEADKAAKEAAKVEKAAAREAAKAEKEAEKQRKAEEKAKADAEKKAAAEAAAASAAAAATAE